MKRTALVTAASIAAVVITGTAAVGANIGILSSADDSPVGELSAMTDVAAMPVEVVVEVPTVESSASPEPTAQPAPTVSASDQNPAGSDTRTEAFRVDQAGTVVVAVEAGTVQVVSVEPTAGWSWTPDDDVPDDSLDVALSSGSEVLVLHVEIRPDGTLDARIDRLQPPAVANPSTTAPSDDDDDDDRYDDDRYDDDEDEDEDEDDDDRYDDDDDDDEHEGRDDDD